MFTGSAKKSLGQHWLRDETVLRAIVHTASLSKNDTVLEIGPGQGNLTKFLVKQAKKVIAIELDDNLAARLPSKIAADNLEVIHQDILKVDLNELPRGYKVVANIPYYLTGHLLKMLITSANPPSSMILLVQKEVAERICAKPGQMSVLAVSVQLYYRAELGQIVPAKLFTPPPKVDSQVVILHRRKTALFKKLDHRKFFQVVKAGFSSPRKKLRSSLAAGLGIDREETDSLLDSAEVNGDLRAQNLGLEQWHKLYIQFLVKND